MTGADSGGDDPNAQMYSKSAAVQTWLFGYEFPETAMLIADAKMSIYCSGKKAQLVSQLNTASYAIDSHVRGKDAAKNKQVAAEFVALVPASVCSFKKDRMAALVTGKVAQELKAVPLTAEEVDFAAETAAVLAVKDSSEQRTQELAAKCSRAILTRYLVPEMVQILDSNRKITHEKLAEKAESALVNEKMVAKFQFPAEVESAMLDWCYSPIV